jgi:uncharacterized protein (TIGR03066 family)
MRWACAVVLFATVLLIGSAPVPKHLMKGKPIDTSKIVGRWELPRDKIKFTYEFKKDGTVVVVAESELSTDVINGTYKITDEKLTYNMMLGGERKVTTVSILVLTDTLLVEQNSEEVLTLTRIKDK